MRKFHSFTGSKFDLSIKWITRKTKTLFKLKDKLYIQPVKCVCGETYIGETTRNVETRWNERNMPSVKSNPSKHLNSNITHHFFKVPVKKLTCETLDVYFITLLKPTLNDLIESDLLHLFENGITQL